MTTATITYNLNDPDDSYEYRCALKALEACLLLESLCHSVKQYQKHDLLSEVVLQDLVTQLRDWEVIL